MNDCVWMSDTANSSRNRRGFIPWVDGKHHMSDDHRDVYQRNFSGEAIVKKAFPEDVYAQKGRKYHTLAPINVFTNGFWYVSAAAAAVMRQFDLGQGNLYPVRLWSPDGKKELPSKYFHLNFGNLQDTFLPNESKQVKLGGRGTLTDRWETFVNPSDNDVALSAGALGGPDIWIEQRILRKFFISDRLKQALEDAKLAKDFRLVKCRVIKEIGESVSG